MMVVKYLVALAVVLLVTWGAIAILTAIYTGSFREEIPSVLVITLFGQVPLMILVLSAAFLLGCLVRQAARAAILSLAVALTLYFAPAVVPVPDRLSFFGLLRILERESTNSPSPAVNWPSILHMVTNLLPSHLGLLIPFLSITLGASALALVLSCVAVSRGWRLQADKKLLSWSLVGVVLVLLAAAALQVGSNLACRQSFEIVPSGSQGGFLAAGVCTNGKEGILLGYPKFAQWDRSGIVIESCAFNLSNSSLSVSSGVSVGPAICDNLRENFLFYLVRSPQRPDRAYFLRRERDDKSPWGIVALELATIATEGDSQPTIVHRLDLLPAVSGKPKDAKICHCSADRLYIIAGASLLTVSLADADAPKLTDTKNADAYLTSDGTGGKDSVWKTLKLLPLKDIPPRQLVEVSMRVAAAGRVIDMEGDLLVEVNEDRLVTYRIGEIEADTARLELIGRRQATLLERFVNFDPKRLVLRNGLAYVLNFSNELSVYDVREPASPRRVAHYAAGGERFWDMAVLPDGSVLLAGAKVQIIEPVRLGD
jgi:hypothetical protein